MITETHRQLVREHIRAFNQGDIEAFVATMSVGAVNHTAIPEAQGRDGARVIAKKLRAAFPDMTMTIDDMICEGSKVACRLTVTGTNTGALEFVRRPLPATGRAFTTTHIHVFRIEDGLIVERWAERDDLGMLQQLGLLASLRRSPLEEAAQ